MPRGHILLSSTTKVCKNAARGLGVLLTPPFVWFRDHILTIVSKFGGDGEVSFFVGLLPMMLVSKGYAWFGTYHGYTGSHFGLQRGDCRARYCKSLDVAVVGVTNEEIPMLRIALRVRLRATPFAQDDRWVMRRERVGFPEASEVELWGFRACPRPTINVAVFVNLT